MTVSLLFPSFRAVLASEPPLRRYATHDSRRSGGHFASFPLALSTNQQPTSTSNRLCGWSLSFPPFNVHIEPFRAILTSRRFFRQPCVIDGCCAFAVSPLRFHLFSPVTNVALDLALLPGRPDARLGLVKGPDACAVQLITAFPFSTEPDARLGRPPTPALR